MSDEDLLLDAIDHARDAARSSVKASRSEAAGRLAVWLEELYVRRRYRPLRCRLGWHRMEPVPYSGQVMCCLCGKKAVTYLP